MSDEEIYIAVDRATVDPFEFVTNDFEAVSEWIDHGAERFYHETTLVDGDHVEELIEVQEAEHE